MFIGYVPKADVSLQLVLRLFLFSSILCLSI
jgi:hypothetical protein